ncbi:paraquat-inducible protein A [Methylocaldum sp.]|uniref:paraquat-inducible protein A n=1 Tax=Methylocaldum sp. TaxID=1969727 RepID=UPI002D5978D4|nr:paraquat-inducible protein A [Methylocaldum sp.]HYE35612.1 paraquat-inducible protein A [Methylocaldum sp.]
MPAVPAFNDLENLCACHECDLLQRKVPLAPGQSARCRRCGALLYHSPGNTLDRTLAFAVAAFILFLVANLYPILGLTIQGKHTEATLLGAVLELQKQGMGMMAGLVLFTTIIVPAMELMGLLYVLLPLKLNRTLRGQAAVFRLIQVLRPWGMVEVLMLGILVSLVKLAHMASVAPGWSLWLFGGFIFVMAATAASLDSEEVWLRLGRRYSAPSQPKLIPGYLTCHACGLLSYASVKPEDQHCPRCGSVLHVRKPNSINRCCSLLIAALILYVPANVLPVMSTSSIVGAQVDTIMSGVVYLWVSGSWPLALLVFFASVMVPLLKLMALTLLLVTVRTRSRWRPVDRTRLYRLTEIVGRWSMVDIFVVTMLVALVDVRPLAAVEAGPGAIAFGAVVVLTMVAAMSFDPRLIWDPIQENVHAR